MNGKNINANIILQIILTTNVLSQDLTKYFKMHDKTPRTGPQIEGENLMPTAEQLKKANQDMAKIELTVNLALKLESKRTQKKINKDIVGLALSKPNKKFGYHPVVKKIDYISMPLYVEADQLVIPNRFDMMAKQVNGETVETPENLAFQKLVEYINSSGGGFKMTPKQKKSITLGIEQLNLETLELMRDPGKISNAVSLKKPMPPASIKDQLDALNKANQANIDDPGTLPTSELEVVMQTDTTKKENKVSDKDLEESADLLVSALYGQSQYMSINDVLFSEKKDEDKVEELGMQEEIEDIDNQDFKNYQMASQLRQANVKNKYKLKALKSPVNVQTSVSVVKQS